MAEVDSDNRAVEMSGQWRATFLLGSTLIKDFFWSQWAGASSRLKFPPLFTKLRQSVCCSWLCQRRHIRYEQVLEPLKVKLLILLIISHAQEELTGYQIREILSRGLGRKVTTGNVYAALGVLERNGCISSINVPLGMNGKTKQCYQIEQAGVEKLNNFAALLEEVWEGAVIPRLRFH